MLMLSMDTMDMPTHALVGQTPVKVSPGKLFLDKALPCLKPRGYLKEQFAWRHFYWSLTNEGIQYLRDYLHLPPEIVPATLKRQPQRETRPRTSAAPRAGGVKPEADREAYRKADDKTGAAGPGSAPMEF